MIESAKDLTSNKTFKTTVCIVGTGAAGIPLALEFENTKTQILLIESGDFKERKENQALYSGTVSNEDMHSPTNKYRLRNFGGSTTIWGGRCMPFDPIDFEARDYIPNSGWPISYQDLAPFYPKANEYLEAGYFAYDAREAFKPIAPPMFKGFDSSLFSTEGLERFSCPTDLGRRYRHRIEQAPNIHCITDANITEIVLDDLGTRVIKLHGATLNGISFDIEAEEFVLAMGGIETTRLMLASNKIHKEGVGNKHDVLGRYYMCHIAGNVGSLSISGHLTDVRHSYEVSPEGIYCRRRIQLNPNSQKEHQVTNMVARLHLPKITDPSHRSGILSGLFMAKSFVSYEYGKRLKDGENSSLKLYLQHFWNILTDPIDTIKFITHWLFKRTLAERKFPTVILPNRTNRFSLEVQSEQRPNPNSRITLIEERDTLGMPKINIDWQYSQQDVDCVGKTLKLFSEEIKQSGIGEFSFNEQNLESELLRFGAYGGHHVGTTKMGDDPKTSIVDKDCKVHDIKNLFIASSSVFPTSSQANPTLTITAMALRLASHLKEKL